MDTVTRNQFILDSFDVCPTDDDGVPAFDGARAILADFIRQLPPEFDATDAYVRCTGSVHLDWDADVCNQLSIMFLSGGKIAYAIYPKPLFWPPKNGQYDYVPGKLPKAIKSAMLCWIRRAKARKPKPRAQEGD